MEDIVFSSQEELYNRITPALRSKKKLLHQEGFKSINEQDIWDFMRLNKWRNSNGLELCDMVDDILNTDNVLIMEFYHQKYMPKDFKIEEFELPKLKDIT